MRRPHPKSIPNVCFDITTPFVSPTRLVDPERGCRPPRTLHTSDQIGLRLFRRSRIPQQGHTLHAGTPPPDPTVITKESDPKIRSAAAYKTNQTRTEPDAPYGAITSTSRDPNIVRCAGVYPSARWERATIAPALLIFTTGHLLFVPPTGRWLATDQPPSSSLHQEAQSRPLGFV